MAMTRRRRLGLSAMVVSVAAVAVFYLTRSSGPPALLTQPITRGDVVDAVGATGTVEAVTTVQVGTQVSGTVLELRADFNTLVRKGQVIARLDPALFQTQVEQARASPRPLLPRQRRRLRDAPRAVLGGDHPSAVVRPPRVPTVSDNPLRA